MEVRERYTPLSDTGSDGKLDPSIERFVDEMSKAWKRFGDLSAVSPAEARRIAEAVRGPWTRGGPRIGWVEIEKPVRIRFYDPRPGLPKPVLVYLHGGGWSLFSLNTHDRVMREYAARAGVVVAGVDYALSPEARYPTALEQVVMAVQHITVLGGEFGIDGRRVAIGGDSAGANLALAAALRLRDQKSVRLRGLVLNYGVFTRRSSNAARQRFGGEGNMLTAAEMERFWANYLRSERDADDPLVSPLGARLEGLPPVLLVVPECDLLTEQSLMLADRLRAANVPLRMAFYPGASHSFLEAVSISPLADKAFDDSAAWLRETL
jgi:acetyl esterase